VLHPGIGHGIVGLSGARRRRQGLAFLCGAADRRRRHRRRRIEHRRGGGAGCRYGGAVVVGGGRHHLDLEALVGLLDLIARRGGATDVLVGAAGAAVLHPLIADRIVGLSRTRRRRQGLAFLCGAADRRRRHRRRRIEHRRGGGAGCRHGGAVVVGGGRHHLDLEALVGLLDLIARRGADRIRVIVSR